MYYKNYLYKKNRLLTEPKYMQNKNIYSFSILLFLSSNFLSAQIGIGTATPKATLDVVGKPNDASILDGVIPPRLTGDQLQTKSYTSAEAGTVVFITEKPNLPKNSTLEITTPGIYQFDGSIWKRLIDSNDITEEVIDDHVELTMTDNISLSAGDNLILYNTDISNPNQWYDKTTGKFQPQKAGLWLVSSGLYTYAGASGRLNQLFLKKNGTENIARYGGYKSTVNKISEVIFFNGSTDYIEVYAHLSNANTSVSRLENSYFTAGYIGGTPSSSTFEIKTTHFGNHSNTIGDVKEAIIEEDHNGWVLLDGRSTSTLTATQQNEAAALGYINNLPDATGAYLIQNGTSLGTLSGSNEKYLVQSNLPPVQIPLTTNTSGAHTHTYQVYRTTNSALDTLGGNERSVHDVSENTNSTGSHKHTGTSNYLHSDTSTDLQEPMDTRPLTLNVNTFIYLGQ